MTTSVSRSRPSSLTVLRSFFIDNVTHTLESGVLAAALTSRIWSDRLLGKSETVSVPNSCLWIATGNNIQLGSEIARRTVWIRLDPKVDRPWERTGFKHDPLGPWVLSRIAVGSLRALLVLVRRWLAAGSPGWRGRPARLLRVVVPYRGRDTRLGWHSRFPREPQCELYRQVDQESEEWRAFLQAWWNALHESRPVKAAELVPLVKATMTSSPACSPLPATHPTTTSMSLRLGKALSARRDRAFGDIFIRKPGTDSHKKTGLYSLEKARSPITKASHGVSRASPAAR